MTDRLAWPATSIVLLFAACSNVDETAPVADDNPAGASREPPPIVQQALADYVAICTESGGKPQVADGVWQSDLNDDGNLDYVLNGHSIHCDGAATAWGDRAKLVRVFAGDDSGSATEVFADLTWGASLEGEGPNIRLWLSQSGEGCGKPPAKDFASENFCDRHIVWNNADRKFEYAPVAAVRMIQ